MADAANPNDEERTALTAAAIKLQSFVRASLCRAQVSNMVAALIDEMMMAKKTTAAQPTVGANVVATDELPETSVHDLVQEMESPKQSNKGKVVVASSPNDLVQEMHGSVKSRLALFEFSSPVVKASPHKKKFWSPDNRGKELGDDHRQQQQQAQQEALHGGTSAAAATAAMETPNLLSSTSKSTSSNNHPGKVDTRLEINATRHVVSSQEIRNEQEARLEEEMQQLVKDIKRLGEKGTHACTFGQLFDDEQVANYYEALVGTLKAAKRKGRVKYEGQMLLKGVSDDVVISIV